MGELIIFCLKVWKDVYFCSLHWKIYLLLVTSCKGEVIWEKSIINFLKYWTTPKKLLTSITLVGFGQSTIVLNLLGSILSCPWPITWPKYSLPNSHFEYFNNNLSLFKVLNTYLRCITCSSQIELQIWISSKYTIIKESINGWSRSLITLMKVVGALHKPNGTISHLNRSYLVLRATFHISSSLI